MQSESARSRLSSVSSTAAWSANSDWVRTNPSSAHIYLLPSAPWVYFLSCDVLHHLGLLVEGQTSPADDHEVAASPGSSGGEDLHRQVGNPSDFKLNDALCDN